MVAAAVIAAGCVSLTAARAAPGPQVLRVGPFQNVPGDYPSIQAAVNAAHPGDWVLIGPGDYHEQGTDDAGVYITTPGVHLRGMDRNATIVDGTRAGAPAPCSPAASWQDRGVKNKGRNGIWVAKADGVSIDNLTVCNFLSTGSSWGNQVWWNGGDGSGTVHLGRFEGSYLTATTTYSSGSVGTQYGLFVSNARGPGVLAHTYASNMSDSGYYIGACPDCNATITDAHAEHNALGFSGTNAGGHLVIEHSRWDDNKAGLAPNVLNNDDAPPPQNGACPGTSTQVAPLISAGSARHCTIIRDNEVDDNNDPNVPGTGIASAAPAGTGIELSGTENVLVTDNKVHDNGAWGIVVHDFPDTETPPSIAHCQGGIGAGHLPLCLFQAYGNEVADNQLANNGFFANPTNGDLADDTTLHVPGNCFHGNTDAAGLTIWPATLATPLFQHCGLPNAGDTTVLTAELLCDSGLLGSCPSLPGIRYPTFTATTLLPLHLNQPSMPDPCMGVPANPWCRT